MASSSSWSGEADAVMMGLFARAMWARRVLTSPPRTSHAARRRLPATRVKSGHRGFRNRVELCFDHCLARSLVVAGSKRSKLALAAFGARCVRRALATAVLRHLLVALFKAKPVQPAARICSARALQLWIGRQQRLDAVDDIRRGRDDVVDASTPN